MRGGVDFVSLLLLDPRSSKKRQQLMVVDTPRLLPDITHSVGQKEIKDQQIKGQYPLHLSCTMQQKSMAIALWLFSVGLGGVLSARMPPVGDPKPPEDKQQMRPPLHGVMWKGSATDLRSHTRHPRSMADANEIMMMLDELPDAPHKTSHTKSAEWAPHMMRCKFTECIEGRIKSHECHGSAQVHSTLSDSQVSCSLLDSLTLVGPVKVVMDHCSTVVECLPACLPHTSPAAYGVRQCPDSAMAANASLLIMCLMETIVIFVLCRLYHLRVRWAPAGYRRIYSRGSVCQFEVALKKTPGEAITFSTEADRVELSEAASPGIQKKAIFTRVLVIAYLFLGKLPALVEPASVPSMLLNLRVSPGGSISLLNKTVYLSRAQYLIETSFVYTALNFSLKQTHDWYCGKNCYREESYCTNFGVHGKRTLGAHELMKPRGWPSTVWAAHCMPGTTGCFASLGCWWWDSTYTFDRDYWFDVHRIQAVKEDIQVTTDDRQLIGCCFGASGSIKTKVKRQLA